MSFEAYPRPVNEEGRLAAIHASGLLFEDHVSNLDHVTALAVSLTGLPRAGVTVLDRHTQYWLSSVDAPFLDLARGQALCNEAIALGEMLVIEDLKDATGPARDVWLENNVRFYASHPISLDGVHDIGTICVFDTVPHRADARLAEQLGHLAAVASSVLQAAAAARNAHRFEEQLVREQGRRETLGQQIERLSHIGAWSLDLETRELTWSDEVFEIHGLARERMPTLEEAITFYAAEDRGVIERAVGQAMETGQAYSFEADIVRPDGSVRRVSAAGDTEIVDGKPRRLAGIIQDLTVQRDREAALEWVLEILSHAREAFVVYDTEGRIVFWNRQAERTFGWTRDEALGASMVDLLQIDPEEHAARTERMMRSGSWSGRVVYKSRSGLNITVLAHKVLIVGKGRMKDGVLVVYQDMSEKMVLSEKMQTATRLDAIGQLTGGIAHDFNNLLTVIMGSADLLKVRLKENPAALKLVEMNRGAAERGRDLVSQLLAFARRQTLDPTATDVAALIDESRPLIERAIGEQYSLSIEMEPGLWLADVDPAKLDSALLNLCINARDACQPGIGRIVVDVRNASLDDSYVASQTDGLQGEFIVLSVSDNGSGMSPEVMRRAIEPFYSTKATEGKTGAGLGLSMTYGFVKQSGGSLQIYSEEGTGTTVRLYLPRSYEVGEEDPLQPEELRTTRPLDILLVEDDPRVQDNSVAMLEALGHRPTTVGTAIDAVRVLETRRDMFDVLFTDIVLPGGMSGFDLATTAHKRWPCLPILFCSGYTHGSLDDHALIARSKMLTKPYTLAELARALAATVVREDGAAQHETTFG
ncbi:PAS domain S-box protein [Acuticoccus sediminis]|uniref:PAS domain S-box protein n=1 Tax=Acuticoccus sediminis TaxID=2184697 RepID=UPI001CFE0DFF|nr:PAS domain S-box protein [Acuticoccus sediminis]